MNDRAKYLAVDEEKNNRIQHIRECFSIIYDEIDLKCKPSRETSLALTKLEEDNESLKQLKNAVGNPIFSCSGYADTRPVTTDEERKAENRRIDLRFTMMPPKESSR